MSSNIEVSIQIKMRPTQSLPTRPKTAANQVGQGHFQIVLEGEKSLDIDALEDGLLRAGFPALREALATHLEQVESGDGRVLFWGTSLLPAGGTTARGGL